jgi:3-oxoacyl-[acyl-carrier protein] reductase
MTDHQGLLDGRRALVFGGGRGIGRATALALGAAGAGVGVVDLHEERAEATAAEIRAAGSAAFALPADIRATADIDRVVTDGTALLGGLDTVVTVVGGMNAFAQFRNLHDYSDEEWDLLLDVNIRYVFRVVRASLRVMLDAGTGGSIVSVGSISGAVSAPHHVPYGVAKAGLVNLARSVAAEYGRFGIRMNVVAPGSVDAPAVVRGQSDEDYNAMTARIPLGRRGLPADIADVVVFFAAPMSRYVTGQALVVDGGVSVRYPHVVRNGHVTEGG